MRHAPRGQSFGLSVRGRLLARDATAPNHTPLTLAYAETDSAKLWEPRATTTASLQLLMVEAELGSRGQFESGDRYLGSRSRSSVGAYRYARSEPSLNDRNCSDFPSSASAQRFFLSAGDRASTRMGLIAMATGTPASGEPNCARSTRPERRSKWCGVSRAGATLAPEAGHTRSLRADTKTTMAAERFDGDAGSYPGSGGRRTPIGPNR